MKNFKQEIKLFAEKLANEARETKEAAKIVHKHMRGEVVTPEEETALKEQFCDVLKMAGIGIPFALIPGASVLLPVLVVIAKKNNINILPSSFDEETKKDESIKT